VLPTLIAGTHGRVDGVIFPYGVAAILLAVCALIHHQGRPVATGLYFVAGLAIVYGLLSLVAVPLRLTVLGTCPPAPALCGVGLERPLTDAENTGLGVAAAAGIVAILLGFFGLVVLFRRFARASRSGAPIAPPVRRIPPVGSKPRPSAPPVELTEPAVTPQGAGAGQARPEPAAPQALAELEAPAEQAELPAPAEPLELPAPTAEEMAETGLVTPEAEPVPKPRRRRTARTTSGSQPPPADAP
jgi:hypothetical protein